MESIINFSKRLLLTTLAVLMGGAYVMAQCPGGWTSQGFTFTGGVQTFTVPAGVTQVYLEARGAQGATGSGPSGGSGGLGASAGGFLNVTPGEVLTIYVGGQNGFNGGANGGSGNTGGIGGGASDVRTGAGNPGDRVVVGGGGGGGGATGCEGAFAGGAGGTGGGGAGIAGADSPDGGGGQGGTVGAGGAAGIGCGGFLGLPGDANGLGGDGQSCCCFGTPRIPAGGGGGGGFQVGGGGGGGSAGTVGCSGNNKGAGGGGAGGTNFVGGVTTPAEANGVQTGDGLVTVCYDLGGGGGAGCPNGWTSQAFSFTGGVQTFTVPAGVTQVYLEATGAQGNAGSGPGAGAGGLGAMAGGFLTVTPGEILTLYVGGQNGFNGGANGGSGNIGGNGGGASDVRTGAGNPGDRVLVGGGGGGGGATGCEAVYAGGSGGGGGGIAGNNGTDSPDGGGGFGGTLGAGGAAGIGCGGFLGQPGDVNGLGGDGQGCCCFGTPRIPAGGGGGGGFQVGGGGGGGSAGTVGCSGNNKGGGGGGAGGSSYVGGVTTPDQVNDIQAGDGLITVCYLPGGGGAGCPNGWTSQGFSFTGGVQTFTVPAGVTQVYLEANGAGGNPGSGPGGGIAGMGSTAGGYLSVTPGEVLTIYVGGQNGFNGGGAGGSGNVGGNGGGASDVRTGAGNPGDRVLVGAGGGGGGATGCEAVYAGGNGGDGGGTAGTAGTDSPDGGGGQGGTVGAGGVEGIGCGGFLGQPGDVNGAGGDGQGCCCFGTPRIPAGGGGGGGFQVGGGGGGGSAGTVGCSGNNKGGGGGGAGGTNYVGGVTTPTIANATQAADGSVTVCYDLGGGGCNIPASISQVPANPICGGPATLSAESPSCTGGVGNYDVNPIAFAPIGGVGTAVFLGDDQMSGALPVGFTFNFYGNNYTDFYISSNGFISFSAGQYNGCCGGGFVPSFGSDPSNFIAAAWDDLYPPGAGSVNYFTTGVAPNRILVVNWTNVPYCCGNTPQVTTQILLYENGNAIEIHSPSVNNINPGTQGIQNLDGSMGTVVAGRNQSNWTATNDAFRFAPPVNCTYVWSTGETTQAIAASTSGTYMVTITEPGGCTGTASLAVTIFPAAGPVTITQDPPTPSCDGTPRTLTASSPDCGNGNYTVSNIGFSPVPGSGTNIPLGDDQVSGALPIGFSFNFYGVNYTDFYAGSNGFITFSPGQSHGCCGGGILPTPGNDPANLIAAAWDDLYPPGGGSISYFTTGVAPNRMLVVNYTIVPFWPQNTPDVTTQIVLYEGSNMIDIHNTLINNINPGTQGVMDAGGNFGTPVAGRNQSNWTANNDAYRFLPPGGGCTYAWSTGEVTESITTVTAGTYTVTVTNGNGCTASATFDALVGTPPAVTINVDPAGPACGVQPELTALVNGAGGNVTFTASFTQGQDGQAFCGDWQTFLASLTGTYTQLRIFSNLNPGITLNDATTVNNIANALLNGMNTSFTFGPDTYFIGGCGAGTELAVNQSICNCASAISVRPCIGQFNSNWGGVNTSTCFGPTQTITVEFGGGGNNTYLWNNGATTAQITAMASGVYAVTVTDANGCSASASQNVGVFSPPTVTITTNPNGPFCGLPNGELTANGPCVGAGGPAVVISEKQWGAGKVIFGSMTMPGWHSPPVEAQNLRTNIVYNLVAAGPTFGSAFYLVSNAGGQPWGMSNNTDAMNTVLGGGGWTQDFFETANAAAIFAPGTSFVFLEGSDGGAQELDAFFTANQAMIETWVLSGGRLFLNAAPNEGGNMNWGFGGVTLDYNAGNAWFSSVANALVPGHNIFNFPFTPVTNAYTGNSFAHAAVTGAYGTALMEGDAILPGGGNCCSFLWSNGETSQTITVTTSGTYVVTLTDCNGCTNTASQAVDFFAPTLTIEVDPVGPACGVQPTLAAISPDCGNNGNIVYYIRPTNNPWGTTSNQQDMDAVFGAGNWIETTFPAEMGNGATIFSPSTRLVFMDGSESGPIEMNNFVTTNIAFMEAWVASGGRLFMNCGPNGGGNQNWGFGGVFLDYANGGGMFSPNVTTAVPGHPIFAGPFTPVTNAYSGGYYAHAVIGGPSGTSLLDGNAPGVVLSELDWGGGKVMFGGMTSTDFHNPNPEAQNLRKNMLDYLNNFGGGGACTYAWSTGETSQSITATVSGTYDVTLTSAGGCTASASVVVNIFPLATATIIPGPNYCTLSDIVAMGTGQTPLQYAWSNGETTDAITPGTPGTYSVTITDANGCTATAEYDAQGPTTVVIETDPVGPACGVNPVLTAASPNCGNNGANVYYIRGFNNPWGQTVNQAAMDAVFGGGNWTETDYNAANGVAAAIFSPATRFVFMDGSDGMATEMENFVNANIALMEAWVSSGGRLFMNAAPNQDNGMNWGFGGVTLNYPSFSGFVSTALPGHPIFNGPFTPVSTSYTGTSYGHATIGGPSGTSLIDGDAPGVVLSELNWGAGLVMFGGMTTTNFHSPSPQAQNVRQNMIDYLNGFGGGGGCTYIWSNGATDMSITATADGTYDVTITTAGGCTASATINVIIYAGATASIVGGPAYCTEAEIMAVGGGTAPFTYLWNTGETTTNITPQIAGIYMVTITDANGCTATAEFDAALPPTLTIEVDPAGLACGISPVLTAVASGAALTYTKTFLGGQSPTPQDCNDWNAFIAQLSGNYSQMRMYSDLDPIGFTLSDAPTVNAIANALFTNGFGTFSFGPDFFNVGNCGGMELSINQGFCSCGNAYAIRPCIGANVWGGVNTPTCGGPTQTITVQFGAGNYTFLWNTGETTESITPLVSGTYSVTLTNNGGCQVVATQVVTIFPAVTATIIGGNDLCALDPMTAVAGGGTAPFNYLWNTGETTETITPGATGTYSVTITDASGCTATAEYDESAAPVVNVVADPANGPYCGVGPVLTANVIAGGASQLADVLAAIDNNAGMLIGLVPNPSGFNMDQGVNGFSIGDGCSDMYDGGNSINTNFAGGIQYSDGVITPSGAFGPGGQYFTRYLGPGGCQGGPATMWFWAADLDGVTNALTSGNNGADGSGNENSLAFTVSNGTTYNCFVKRVFNAGDPSINQLFIVPNGGGVSQLVPGNTDNNYHELTGLGANNRMYYLLYASAFGGFIDDATTMNIAQNFVNLLGAGVTYQWSDGSTTASITPGASGNYCVTVTDQNGCTGTACYNLVVSPAVTASIVGGVDACAYDPMTAVAGGGTAPFTYLWNTGETTDVITPTASGTYTVTITDASGCTATAEYDETAAPSVTITPDPAGPFCGNIPVLSADVIAGGGQAASFTASFVQGQDGQAFCGDWQTFLASLTGTYTQMRIFSDLNPGVTLTDPTTVNNIANALLTGANTNFSFGPDTYFIGGCGGGTELSVNQSTCNCGSAISVRPCIGAFNSNWGGVNTANCGGPTQTITVEFTSSSLTYLWNTGETTDDITPGGNGNYCVTVTDDNGCTGTACYNLVVNPAVVATITGGPAYCDSGPITVEASGGTAPFTYLWNNGETNSTFTVTVSGIYTVTVTDGVGCTATASMSITIYPNPTVTVTQDLPNPLCGPNTVVLTATGAGAVGVAGNKALIVSNVEPVGWGFPGVYNSLDAVYGVGGWTEFRFETANAAAIFDVNNFGVVHMDGSNSATTELLAFLSANQGLIEGWVNQGGVLLLNYATNETNNDNLGFGGVQSLFSATGTGNVVAPGHPIFNGPLMPTAGPYGGSSFNHNVIVNGGTPLITDSNGQPCLTELTWGNGRVLFGGLTLPFFEQGGFGWTPQPNVLNMYKNIYSYMEDMGNAPATYTYVWSTGSTDATTTVNVGGTYTVTVTDNHGCTGTASYDIMISNIAVSGVGVNTTCNGANGSIDLTTTGAIGPVTYLWDNGSTDEDLANIMAGTYVVTATDANGCTATASVTIGNDADVTPPTILCPANTTITSPGAVTLADYTGAAIANDNCPGVVVTQSPAIGTVYNTSQTVTVALTATDASGNTVSCAFEIVITITGGCACPFVAGVVYVDDNAVGANTGLNWCDAYTSLQSALTAVGPGGQIWVKEGWYYPTAGVTRTATFNLKPNMSMYGGFPDNMPCPGMGDRNADTFLSNLSGDIGTIGVNTDNSYRVVRATNVGASVLVDGVVIRDGYADVGANINGAGLGVTANGAVSSPTFINCDFVSNYADTRGGGAFLYALNAGGVSNTSFTDCNFMNNVAGADGGGVSTMSQAGGTFSGNFDNCSFTNNNGGLKGGGVGSWVNAGGGSSLNYSDCTFSGNTAITNGGGIWHYSRTGGALTYNVDGCSFSGNSSANGAAMYHTTLTASMTGTVHQCTFMNNSSANYGTITTYSEKSSTQNHITIDECMFMNNTSLKGGGLAQVALTAAASTATVTQSTFGGNTGSGGGSYHYGSGIGTSVAATLENNDYYGNTSPGSGGAIGTNFIGSSSGNLGISFCSFSGNAAATNGGAIQNFVNSGGTSTINASSSIFWGNTVTAVNGRTFGTSGAGATTNVTNSIVGNAVCAANHYGTGVFTCAGIVALDPMFVSPSDLDLTAGSPAIDAANAGPAEDIDGNTRPFGPGWDWGAHEYGAVLPRVAASAPTTTSENLDMTLFPNPTTDAFTVQFTRSLSGTVEIIDLQGRVLHTELVNDANQLRLTLDGRASGTYYVRLISANDILVRKVVLHKP